MMCLHVKSFEESLKKFVVEDKFVQKTLGNTRGILLSMVPPKGPRGVPVTVADTRNQNHEEAANSG